MAYAGLVQTTSSLRLLSKEVLVMIFTELYYASCDINLDYASPSSLVDQYLFPRCVADVCRQWKRVARSLPLVSTRIIIFVDELIVLEDLSKKFKASESNLINVFVIRRNYPDAGDPREKIAIGYIVKALDDHIGRCQVLVFDLLHSRSLPHASNFTKEAPRLRTLRVKSRKVDDVNIPLRPFNGPAGKVFICQNLQYLDLHGRFFLEALQISDWCEGIRKLSRKQLSVSHLRLQTTEFGLRKLMISLAKLGHLTRLYLGNVEVDTSSCKRPPAAVFIQNFEFEDLSRDFVGGFFTAYENDIDVSTFTLRRCQLGIDKPFKAWNLTLRDIPVGEDITEFVSQWDGYSLRLDNCPEADNQLLDTLSTEPPDGRQYNSSRFFAPTLREMLIHFTEDSPSSISAEGVRKFVMGRMVAAAEGRVYLAMHSVHAFGHAPPITDEDKSWLQDNLEFFTWSRPQDELPSPTQEGNWDLSELDDYEVDYLNPPRSPSPTLVSSSQPMSDINPSPSQFKHTGD